MCRCLGIRGPTTNLCRPWIGGMADHHTPHLGEGTRLLTLQTQIVEEMDPENYGHLQYE